MRFACVIVGACVIAQAQGTDPKPKAEDYEAHAQTPHAAVGAEFMVHSFSGQGQTYIAKDFLVVEVALYPAKGQTIQARAGEFALRINGKKEMLRPVAPSVVVSEMQHPGWTQDRHVEAGGGVGNTGVIFGRPTPSQIPGEPPQPRAPRTPRAPDPDNPSGVDPQPRVTAGELVVQTALPEDPHQNRISGFIYFPYKGKPSGIKSLELLFDGVSIKLR